MLIDWSLLEVRFKFFLTCVICLFVLFFETGSYYVDLPSWKLTEICVPLEC